MDAHLSVSVVDNDHDSADTLTTLLPLSIGRRSLAAHLRPVAEVSVRRQG